MSALEHVIPEGYKQTEVGLIPNDWFVKTFGQVMSIRHGKDQKAVQVPDGCYPIFGTGGKMGTTNTALYDKPSVLIGRKGTINKPRYIDKPFWTVDTLFYSVVSNSESAKFIYYKFCMIDWMQYNEASGVPSLNASTIESVSASFPELKEQTAIANALSDVDALISELEKLIAKKQAIKTATMQQLLTGRTRLPQFALRDDGTPTNSSGTNLDAGTGGPKGEGQDGLRKSTKQSELGEIPEDWEVELLRSVCDSFKTGKLDANAMKPDGEYRFYTCAKEYYYIDRYAFDEEALMVSGNGANVGYVHYYKGKFNAYQRTYVLSNFIADVIYLKIYLERKLAERIRVEVNAGNTPYITMDTLTDMPIVLPPKEEQIAIATILSDMDTEIQALEQRLSKTRQIKQGMMQELLTGRTRLPFEKEQ